MPRIKKEPKSAYRTMITCALEKINEKGGSTEETIVKYIMANYLVDDEKTVKTQTKRAITKAVADGYIRRVKGSGASVLFKLIKQPKAKASTNNTKAVKDNAENKQKLEDSKGKKVTTAKRQAEKSLQPPESKKNAKQTDNVVPYTD